MQPKLNKYKGFGPEGHVISAISKKWFSDFPSLACSVGWWLMAGADLF
jgi:hypothetical protein